METKKLIVGFLILAVMVSFGTLLVANLWQEEAASPATANTQPAAQTAAPKNVFIEQLPATPSVSEKEQSPTDDGLPPPPTSNNLTDRLAESVTRNMVQTNPGGPSQDTSGLAITTPNLDTAIQDALGGNVSVKSWNIVATDADLHIIQNPSQNDIETYLGSFSSIIQNFAAPSLQDAVKADTGGSADVVNAVSVAMQQADADLRKLNTPQPFVKIQKDMLTVVEYEKNAIAAINSDDPLQGALEMQRERTIFNAALADLQSQAQQVNATLKNTSFKKDTAAFIASALGINVAHAQFASAVFDVPAEISDAATVSNLIADWAERLAVQILKNYLINKIMAQTVNWINGGGKPQFITNWKGFLSKAENDAAGIAIQNLAPGLCRSFGPLIQLNLQKTFMAEPVVTCTLDQVVANVKNFYNDFAAGGWVGYGTLILPSSNYFGQLFESEQQVALAQAQASQAKQNDALANKGFLSQTRCVEPGPSLQQQCLDSADQNYQAGNYDDATYQMVASRCSELSTEPDTGAGCLETQVITPGEAVGTMLDNALGAPVHLIVNSNDVIGLVAALTNSLMNKLISAGVNGLLGAVVPSTTGNETNPSSIVPEPTVPPERQPSPTPSPTPLPTPGPTPPPPPPIDLNTATIAYGPGDVASWSQTATIASVNVGTDGAVSIDFDKKEGANRWPDQFGGPGVAPTGDIEYTVWLFEYINGQWYGASEIQMWHGRPDTGAAPPGYTVEQQLQLNWVYNASTMRDHTLAPGETVGFMVTAGNDRGVAATSIKERSDVKLVTLP